MVKAARVKSRGTYCTLTISFFSGDNFGVKIRLWHKGLSPFPWN